MVGLVYDTNRLLSLGTSTKCSFIPNSTFAGGSQLYVINDISLIPVVQRQLRPLSLSLMFIRVFSYVMGVGKVALEIVGRDPIEDHGFLHQINSLSKSQPPVTVDMFQWASLGIMMATTNVVYGLRDLSWDSAVRVAY